MQTRCMCHDSFLPATVGHHQQHYGASRFYCAGLLERLATGAICKAEQYEQH